MSALVGRLVPAYPNQCFVRVTKGETCLYLPLDLACPWQTGQVRQARVRRLRAGAEGGGGFCDDASGQSYFLRRTQGLHEGQQVNIEIRSEPRAGKPSWAKVIQGPVRESVPGPVQVPEAPSLGACLALLGHHGAIEAMGLDLLKELRCLLPQDDFCLGDAGLDARERAVEALEVRSLERDQISVRWDRTPTAHFIDVDGLGPVHAINLVALDLAAEMMVSRNLGGIIFIDFLAPKSKAARRDVANLLTQALSVTPHQLKIHAMNESGHLIVERQRLGPEFHAAYFAGQS